MTAEFTSLIHPGLTRRATLRWPGSEVWHFFDRSSTWSSYVLRRHGLMDTRLGRTYRDASTSLAALGVDRGH